MALAQGILFLGLHTGVIEAHPLPASSSSSSGGGHERKEIAAHKGIVRQLLVHPSDPSLLFSCSVDQTVKSWSVPSCAWVMAFTGHAGPVNCIAVDPAKRGWLYSGCDEGVLKVWDIPSGAELQSLRCHVGCITSMIVPRLPPPPPKGADGEEVLPAEETEEPPKAGTILTGSNDTIGKLLEPASKLVHAVFRVEQPICSIAYAHPQVYYGCSDGVVRGFHVHTAKPTVLLRWGHQDGINQMLPLFPGNRLLTVSDDRRFLLWNTTRWSNDFSFPVAHERCVTSMVLLEEPTNHASTNEQQQQQQQQQAGASVEAAAPVAKANSLWVLTAGFDGEILRWGLDEVLHYVQQVD